ncbi:MAG: hypothetical protein EBS78_11605 [Altererythrobacter sp.]|nr:hypothetical protein [Altererythrobacter sp.]
MTSSSSIKSTSTSGGIGYGTGAGGTVTQATSKSTGVTLDKVCGEITMNNATLNRETAVAAGSCRIQVHNLLGGTDLSEAIVLSFAVIKAVAA